MEYCTRGARTGKSGEVGWPVCDGSAALKDFKLNVLVTGATGFVGQHVVRSLLGRNHKVIVVARHVDSAKKFEWFDSVEIIQADLYKDYSPVFKHSTEIDALVHLAWEGLPNYESYFHIDRNLQADLSFLRSAIISGIRHIVVSGTCLEYGHVEGELSEEMATNPITPYGFAKDVLRKSLEFLQKEKGFCLQWMRLFYMYGEGQNENSLISQLDRAISEKLPIFNMSSGTQIRDYLPINAIAEAFACAIGTPEIHGVVNCCSGQPISVLDLVRKICEEKGSAIKLNRGFYELPQYEPYKFWGNSNKFDQILRRQN